MRAKRMVLFAGLVAAVTVAVALRPSTGRAAYPAGRFTVAPLTAVDTVTGLMWQRGYQAGLISGPTPTGTAMDYCENLVLDGRSDWRLPSGKELLSVWDPYAIGTTIDTSVFTMAPGYFHSSSPVPNIPSYAYGVSYTGLGAFGLVQTNSGANARCVRTVPTDGGS